MQNRILAEPGETAKVSPLGTLSYALLWDQLRTLGYCAFRKKGRHGPCFRVVTAVTNNRQLKTLLPLDSISSPWVGTAAPDGSRKALPTDHYLSPKDPDCCSKAMVWNQCSDQPAQAPRQP